MTIRYLSTALAGITVFFAATAMAAQPDYAYMTTIQLASGKALQCAVNEPLPGGETAAALTRSEQTKADVLATQRLRVLSGPDSPYPSPYTAPHVTCADAG